MNNATQELAYLRGGGYVNDWDTVCGLVSYFSNGPAKADRSSTVIREAIKATSNPKGKGPEELEAIAEYHGELVGDACECPACLAYDRIKGARS